MSRRGYSQAQLDAAVASVVAERNRLRAELTRAYARCDDVFKQFEALAREVGRLDLVGLHPSTDQGD